MLSPKTCAFSGNGCGDRLHAHRNAGQGFFEFDHVVASPSERTDQYLGVRAGWNDEIIGARTMQGGDGSLVQRIALIEKRYQDTRVED